MALTFCGVLAGKGHTFTPGATAVISAAPLAWKELITGFATGLNDKWITTPGTTAPQWVDP